MWPFFAPSPDFMGGGGAWPPLPPSSYTPGSGLRVPTGTRGTTTSISGNFWPDFAKITLTYLNHPLLVATSLLNTYKVLSKLDKIG